MCSIMCRMGDTAELSFEGGCQQCTLFVQLIITKISELLKLVALGIMMDSGPPVASCSKLRALVCK